MPKTFDEILAVIRAVEAREMLDTYRLGDPDFDRKRALFYARCARVFGFEGWDFGESAAEPAGKMPGRDGQAYRAEKYGEKGIASYRNVFAGTVEMFESRSELLNSEIEPPHTDEKVDQAACEGSVRRRAARQFRDLFESAAMTPLRSPELDRVPTGFGPRSPHDRALDAMATVREMRNNLPPLVMRLLEDVVIADQFMWLVDDRRRERAILQDIRMALDFAAYEMGVAYRGRQEIRRDDLCRRWEYAREFFYQKMLRPARHAGRVVSRRTR